MRFLWWLIDASVNNAHILFNLSNPDATLTQIKFREQLISELIGDVRREKAAPSFKEPRLENNLEEKTLNHYVVKINNLQTCEGSRGKKRHRAMTGCSDCKVALCIECYKDYHEEKKKCKVVEK